ncbi:MAG: hypothetical protein AB4042_13700 [Leptolyngbyaceae cyanobacterium]
MGFACHWAIANQKLNHCGSLWRSHLTPPSQKAFTGSLWVKTLFNFLLNSSCLTLPCSQVSIDLLPMSQGDAGISNSDNTVGIRLDRWWFKGNG